MPGMWAVFIACRAPEPEQEHTPGSSSPDPLVPPAVVAVDRPPDVPLIDEALALRCPDPTPVEPPVPPGEDLHKVTLTGGTSLCNDGTAPAIYIRAASNEARSGDWVLYIDGGNSCDSYEECAERWCGEDYHDASKMSSRWLPQTRRAAGIVSDQDESAFGDWNHVVFHYCSSDRWSGDKSDHVFTEEGQPPFRLYFHGSRVIDEAISALSTGVTSDDGAESLSGIDDASRVVFVGSSAGSFGVITNLDRVAEALPGVEVVGLPDAIFFADPSTLDADDASEISSRNEELHTLHDRVWGDRLDASCEAANGETPICSDLGAVLRDHLSTPFLLHHDLYDPNVYNGNYDSVMSMEEYAQAAVDTFTIWQQQGVGSVFLTGCGVHQYVQLNERFFGWTTAPEGGEPESLHSLFVKFMAGDRPQHLLDAVSGSRSQCGEP